MRKPSNEELLQRYRRDRRELLKYILRTAIPGKILLQPGSLSIEDVDLDSVSVDYVLHCVKKGVALDFSEAVMKYYEELRLPPMTGDNLGRSYLLVSDPESSGPPPERKPPPIMATSSDHTPPECFSFDDDVNDYEEDEEDDNSAEHSNHRCQFKNGSDLVLLLPPFKSGLSNDELRETAYEVLLASVSASGGLVLPNKEIRKEKKSKLIRKLTGSKSGKHIYQTTRAPGLSGLLNTMRVQMEISEKMDYRIREGLVSTTAGRGSRGMDTLLVPLELLCSISPSSFSDKKTFIRWEKRQLRVLEEGLLNNPAFELEIPDGTRTHFRALIATIEEAEEAPASFSSSKRMEALRALRRIAIELSRRSASFDISGEVCHWADGYYLNVQLYEKLLYSVFDLLDEGNLLEETEEFLELLRLTWRTLGITQSVHDICFAWVLFHQFVMTGESVLLQQSIMQMEQVLSESQHAKKEWEYMTSLCCHLETVDGHKDLSFIESFLLPIKNWCDKHLRNYHLLTHQELINVEGIATMAIMCSKLICGRCEGFMIAGTHIMTIVAKQVEDYIISSTNAAYERALGVANSKFIKEHEHPLKTLAEEVMAIVKKDSTLFSPIFVRWNTQSMEIAASLLHSLYGRELKPFVDGVKQLSDEVVSVFPAADILEQCIFELISYEGDEDEDNESYKHGMSPYQVELITNPLITQWISLQHQKITEWVERCVQQERWEPVSSQQRHGASIVDVYRIMEETVEQIFDFNLPMRFQHLKLLLTGFDNALQLYSQNIINQLGKRNDLVPPTPQLTRYKKVASMNTLTKKRSIGQNSTGHCQWSQTNEWSTPTLCVRLNSLQYLLTELNALEENMQGHWTRRKPGRSFASNNIKSSTVLEAPMDRFSSIFHGTREIVSEAIDKLCEFLGIKVIFCDMRQPFVEGLYRGSVSEARIEDVINILDSELRQVCDVIVDSLRDQVVITLLQASLDAYVRVLLDGGPCRVFSQNDAKMLEEDLELLKEFFMAGGDGLSSDVVETILNPVKQIISLYSLETHIVIEELMHASEKIGTVPESGRYGQRSAKEPYTLLRVLCHRSDKQASKFLKTQYKLPKSADYESTPVSASPFKESPFSALSSASVTDLWKRSASFRWSEDGQRSFKLLRQKIHEATLEFKQGGW